MRVADALHVRAQDGAVQSLHERGVTWVSFKPIPDRACGIDFTLRKLPDLGLLSGAVQGLRHEHARRDSGDGDDDFSFHMNLSGLSFVSGARGEMTLGDGDAMLLNYSVSRTISRPGLVDHRIVRLPRAALSPLVRNIDDAVLCRIPSGTGMLSLLRNYVDAVFNDPALAMPEMRQLIIAQLCDLIAVTLGATRDATAVAGGRGIRASAATRHQDRYRSAPHLQRTFAWCRCEAPGSVRQLHSQALRGRRNFILTIRPRPSAHTRTTHVNRSTMGRP